MDDNYNRTLLFVKRRIKLNRFLLVIDTKKGVVISAITVIIVDLVDLLWNLSMTFGPLNFTMSMCYTTLNLSKLFERELPTNLLAPLAMLILIETFLVVCVSSVLLYSIKTNNKADLRSILLIWLIVVAIDYILRSTIAISALIISEKASTTAKVMKSIASIVMLVLVAHCWLCVFTFYDDNNGKMTTVKITPSDDKGRLQFNKRQILLMKPASGVQTSELSAANLERDSGGGGANMLRAPTEDAPKSRW